MSLGSFRSRLLMQPDDDEACRECATKSDFSRFRSVLGTKRRHPLAQRIAGKNRLSFSIPYSHVVCYTRSRE